MTDTTTPVEAAPAPARPWYSRLWSLVAAEPVAAQGLIQAFLVMGEAFGLHLTAGQMASINVFVAAALAFILRRHVVPLSRLPVAKGEQ